MHIDRDIVYAYKSPLCSTSFLARGVLPDRPNSPEKRPDPKPYPQPEPSAPASPPPPPGCHLLNEREETDTQRYRRSTNLGMNAHQVSCRCNRRNVPPICRAHLVIAVVAAAGVGICSLPFAPPQQPMPRRRSLPAAAPPQVLRVRQQHRPAVMAAAAHGRWGARLGSGGR